MQYVITQGTIRLAMASPSLVLRNSLLNSGIARLNVEFRWRLLTIPNAEGVKSRAEEANPRDPRIIPSAELIKPSRKIKSKKAYAASA